MTSVLLRRRPAPDPVARLGAPARDALAGVLAAPKFELIPLRSAMDQAALLPPSSLVSVTASPARRIEATVELCVALAARGHRPIAHLSAHDIRDRSHLATLLRRMRDGGVERAFVVGGDGREPGEFRDGLALLRAMADLGHGLSEIGIPCYPEGHPSIPAGVLLAVLRAKSAFAQYMTTQMCFSPQAIAAWLGARRAEELTLPVYLGVPGPAELSKLMSIAARIGVADSRRFLARNPQLVGRLLLHAGGFAPDALLEGLAPLIADPVANVRGIHLYTFNQVEATEAWRGPYLRSLSAGAELDAAAAPATSTPR